MSTYYDVKLLTQRPVAEGTAEFVIEKPEGFTYRAGQFGDIVLPREDGSEDSGNKHGFSFVSAPCEPNLRMATRMRGTPFKQAIAKLPVNADIKLIATFGDFTLHKNEKVPAVFVIGGIGITPVVSMVSQATEDGLQHSITVIYANRTPAQAAYLEELQALAERNANFTFVPVFTADSGHVNADTLRRNVPDISGSKYYLSGPDGMVKAMRSLLIDVGADEDNIRTEEFSGY